MLASYIHGLYRGIHHPLAKALGIGLETEQVADAVGRVLPVIRQIRQRLGWRQREVDLGLLRWIRRSSALSVVLGAGATMAAGGPSWAELVRSLLQVALERGHEITTMVPDPGNTRDHASYSRQVIDVKRLPPEAESEARQLAEQIDRGQADTEQLMRGAQLCLDLFGQHLFTHVTQIIYARAKQPGPIHRAIAELAEAQEVPERGPGLFPGWEAILTYNFDDLMSQALRERKIPCMAWAMSNGEVRGDGDPALRESPWYQPIYHLHGYTPSRLFLITHIEFVFSTAQYLRTYGPERRAIIDLVFERYLANPVHVALYAGCSFADEAMNDLLRRAAQQLPGRWHYAFLKWPEARRRRQPSPELMDQHAARYVAMGVQPIWVDDYDEIPDLIRSLR